MSDRFTAFAGHRLLASGEAPVVAAAAKAAQDAGQARVLILDDSTGEPSELDPRETIPTIAGRPAPQARAGRGRPRLGVVAREVTLLPRHWDWLATQPGGASAALRRLVEDASRQPPDAARLRQAATHKAMTALAGDLPGYEEALRALYSGRDADLEAQTQAWPGDVAAYLRRLHTGES